MPVILTNFRLPDPARELLREVGQWSGPEAWETRLGEADALVTVLTARIDRELLERAPRLRVVANVAVGYDNVDVAACRESGVVVTNTPDVLTEATADLALALILSVVRGLRPAEASLRAGEFREWRFWDYLGGRPLGGDAGHPGHGQDRQGGGAPGRRLRHADPLPQPHAPARGGGEGAGGRVGRPGRRSSPRATSSASTPRSRPPRATSWTARRCAG